jgi:hypothetical protein
MTDGKDLVVLASLKVLVVDLNDRGTGAWSLADAAVRLSRLAAAVTGGLERRGYLTRGYMV